MTGSANILIVDDDPDIRTLLAEYLESNGCLAETAADGGGMWQALDEHVVDLVVLDRDPFAGPREQIHQTRVRATFVAGQEVWSG